MPGKCFPKFLNDTCSLHCFGHFSLIWLLKFRLSFKNNPKCFCQLAQTTGALLKRFLDDICLVSWKISLPEYVLNQDWKIFSTYKPIQIFFADFISSFTEMLLSFRTKINDMSSAKSCTVHSKLPDMAININNEKMVEGWSLVEHRS